jgi:Fe2+ or Zn2+ uptake regulation protein
MKEEKLLRKILEDNHYKITRARLLIFKLLRNNEPQTITRLVAASTKKIDRVSVYRVINLYERLGVVKRINIGWKYRLELSEIFLDHHHHISCLGCGRVVAIKEDVEIEKLIEKLGKTSGFVLKSHQLELQGYCNQCRKSVRNIH